MRERADNPGKPNQIGSCGAGAAGPGVCEKPNRSQLIFPLAPIHAGPPSSGIGVGSAPASQSSQRLLCPFFQMPGKCLPDPLCKSGANEAFAIYTSLSSLKGGGVCAVHMIYLSALGKMPGPDLGCFLGFPRWVFSIQHQGKKSWKLPLEPPWLFPALGPPWSRAELGFSLPRVKQQ